jgi:hypothetical protein
VASFLRNPLGLFATILVVGIIVIAVGVKAFGGTTGTPTPTPLSSEQFAQLGEHACISLRRELKPVTESNPSTSKGAARSVHRTASILAGLNLELDGQIPPSAEVARFRNLLAVIQSADRAMQQLDRLTETGQWQRAVLLVRSPGWRQIRTRPSASDAATRCGQTRRTDKILAAVAVRVSRGAAAASYYFAKPLSPAQYVSGLEHMCVSTRAFLEQIDATKPASLADVSNIITALTSALDSGVLEFRTLTPPPSIAAPARILLGKVYREQRDMHNLDELAGTGQWPQAQRLVRSREWRAMASAFGGPPVKRAADINCG